MQLPGIFKLLTVVLCAFSAQAATNTTLPVRGYYTTFMRMPTFGLPEWKQMVDYMEQDGANTLLLWTAGGFKSKKFPVTWQYNRDHKNVRNDFVRELIDYSHSKGIKVLLCLTPFGYDGVNQFPKERPELKARQKNGEPTQYWGLHSWGWNLCPAEEESQRFMLDYAREMLFDFYPGCDGVLLESSDYAICYCSRCKDKFFTHEFQFVRKISDEIWTSKKDATGLVYPHYFSPRRVPGFDVMGATHEFDNRWSLFFTPHSAHVETNLASKARSSFYSDEGLSLGRIERLQDGIQVAQKNRLTGYIASLEPFSCPSGPPENPGKRLKPFHFEWLDDGEMPLKDPFIKAARTAFREFTKVPSLPTSQLYDAIGNDVFNSTRTPQAVSDLLFVQECVFAEAEWFSPGLLLNPKKLQKLKDNPSKVLTWSKKVDRLNLIAKSYADAKDPAARQISEVAQRLSSNWVEVFQQ